MDYWQVLFSINYFAVLILVSLLQALVIWLVAALTEKTDGGPVYEYLLDLFAYPIAQSGLTLLFIFLTYPVLYGLSSEQNYPELFAINGKPLSNLFNILIFLGFLLPVIPIVGAFKGLVLALQVIIASQILLHWMLSSIDGDILVQYLPSTVDLFMGIIMVLLFQWLASKLGLLLGRWLNEKIQVQGSEILFESGVGFFLQGLLILEYTLFLGKQLPQIT